MSRPQVLYRLLLTAYPRSFRRRYADMALADFGVLHHDIAAKQGLVGLTLLWLRTVPGVLRDGWRERRTGSGLGPFRRSSGGGGVRPRRGLEQVLQDVRYGVRSLLKAPAFALIAILTIGVGMTANATIYGMVYALVFTELPYADDQNLVIVWTTYPDRGVTYNASSVPDWADIRSRVAAFEDVAFHQGWEVNLSSHGDDPVGLTGYRVTPNTFGVLRVGAAMGRAFEAADGEPGADPVVVLSWRLWQRLGAPADIVGTDLLLNETRHAVVGVMPEGFDYPQLQFRGDLWTAMQLSAADLVETRQHRHVVPIARLAPDTEVETANVELDALMEQLEAEYPETNRGARARAAVLRTQMTEPIRPALAVLLATVGFVLLICCANVANLFLVRGASREAEFAIRSSLGASRIRLVRQLLTEALLVALAGGILGYLGSEIAGRMIVSWVPDFVRETSPTAMESGPQPVVLLLTFAVAAAAGIVFGLVPALRAARPNLEGVLRAGAGASGGRVAVGRLRKLLVVAQVAVAGFLIAGAGLMVKGFSGLLATDPGFNAAPVLTAELALNGPRYDESAARHRYYERVGEALRALPGVEMAGVSTILPLAFANNSTSFITEALDPETDRPLGAGYRAVTPGYLEAMGARVLAGRLFDATDDADAPAVVVVNEALLKHLPDGDPVGQRIKFTGDEEWNTIVGVVGSFRHSTLLEPATPAIFMSYAQSEGWRRMFVAVRAAGDDPAQLAASVRQAVWSVDPAIPVDQIRPLVDIVDDSLFVFRFPTTLMALLGIAALGLAAVGLYGVIAFLVTQRSREVGIRLALGAGRGDVLRLILRSALGLTAVGVVLGLLVAVPMGVALASVLQGVNASEPLIYLGVPILLLLVSAVAALVPARRALRVDPVASLRAE